MRNRPFHSDGVPIEEAPFWVLVIAVCLTWLMVFPGIVGLMHGFGLWHGQRLVAALAGAVVAVALIGGLASRKPWPRPRRGDLLDQRPVFARFSTWLITVVLYPNLMVGAILLLREGPPPDYAATAVLGLLISAVQGVLTWTSSRKWRFGQGRN